MSPLETSFRGTQLEGIMKKILLGGLLAAPGLSLPPLSIEQVVADESYMVDPSPVPIPTSSYLGMATGDFDADYNADLAFFVDDHLHVQFAPGMFDAGYNTGIKGTSVASLPINADGTFHGMVIAQSSGLSVVQWSHVGSIEVQHFDSDPLNFGIGEMTTVRSMATTSGMYLAANLAGSTKVHIFHTPDTYLNDNTSWSSLGVHSLNESVVDFELINWEAGGHPEIAICSDHYISVRSLPSSSAPPLLQRYAPPYKNLALEVITRSASVESCVALLLEPYVDPNAQHITIFGRIGMASVANMTGSSGILRMKAKDYDNNGTADIVVTRGTDYDVEILFASDDAMPVFENSTAFHPGQPFPKAAIFSTGFLGAPGDEVATPGIADIDGDGDMDLCVPIYAEQRLWIYTDPTMVDQNELTPRLVLDESDIGVELVGSGKVEYTIALDSPIMEADGVEVLAWKQDGPLGTFEQAPFFRDFIPKATFLAGPVTVNHTVSSTTGYNFNEIVYVSLRQVSTSTSSTGITGSFPSQLFIYHGADSSSNEHEDFIANFPSDDNLEFFTARNSNNFVGPIDPTTGHGVPCLPSNGSSRPATN